MTRIKGLIFDLDGTLIDNYDAYMELMLRRVGNDLGRDFGLQHAKDLWYAIDAESRDEVIERWGVHPDKFWTVFNRYESLDEKLKSTYLHKDASILRNFKVPKGIVTHTSYDHTDQLLKMTGIRDLFNPIVSCTEDTGYKPSPLPIIYCVVDMKLGFDEVVYVGDTVSDIMAAKNAHVKSVYINRFNRPLRIKPDYEIDSLEKLADLIE